MESKTAQLDPKRIDIDEWYNIITNPNFKKVRVYIQNRIQSLEMELNRLSDISYNKPNLDSSVYALSLKQRSNELSKFLSHIDYKLKQFVQYKGDK